MAAQTFASEEELDALVARFEARDVTNEEFSHRYHLAMAACTVFERAEGSLDRVRSTILQINERNGVRQTETGGYHETLTVAWHALVLAHVRSLPEETPRLLAVNSVLHAFADKQAVLKHYSRGLLMSWQARRGFVPPDLAPLP